ncbi:MFS transporter [Streptomyces rectiverticillatus]|uniref:hypothetical protein n=1 Tax=Streptomyces rectiverticillatus TaxID=173860 RepID=UPI0015C4087B|nr:hypothetical protein [Streptomyces rectiverticillatus]QLE75140.1 MFS transporter [Streptomyces rectiverticillatus]
MQKSCTTSSAPGADAGCDHTPEQPEAAKRGGLWRDADFLKFWGTESLSMFGTQISMPAMSGVGAFAGSVLAGRLARRWGLGRTIVATTALACAAPLLIPIAGGNGDGNGTGGRAAATAVIAVALLLNGAGVAISNIHVVSLRQTGVPPPRDRSFVIASDAPDPSNKRP